MLFGDRTSVAGLPGVRTIHSAITTLAHKFSPRKKNATDGSFEVKNKEFFVRLIFYPTFWTAMAVFSGALKSQQGFHANEVASSSSSNWSVFIKAKFVIKFLLTRRVLLGYFFWVSVKWWPDGGGWWMADGGWRIIKCGWQNVDGKMRMIKYGW